MKIIEGKYNTAKVFTDVFDYVCEMQIRELLNQKPFRDAKIRIMPDCHAGASCVIGFTADFGDKVIPNVVGVDIGCGMYTLELGKVEINFPRFDSIVNECIPHGRNVHSGRLMRFEALKSLTCYRELKDTKKMERSIGSLGGGNHFIEIDADEDGNKYLVIHTGSRKLGQEVCRIHQKIAWNLQLGKEELWIAQKKLIDTYKAAGRRTEIHEAVKELHRNFKIKKPELPEELAYLYGGYAKDYLHDMKICQDFADANRKVIAQILIEKYGFNPVGEFTTVHNYIDHDTNMIRKGAVSAQKGERLLIPINMAEGALLCIGKGNDDWNQSAPHGAGRLYSRKAATHTFTIEEYQRAMEEAAFVVYWCKKATLDEKMKAWQEIIKTMPDCSMESRTNMMQIDSFHGFLRDYMALLKQDIQNFLAGDGCIYSCEYHEHEIEDSFSNEKYDGWYGKFELFFSDYDSCTTDCRKKILADDTINAILIFKCPLNQTEGLRRSNLDTISFNNKLEIMDVYVSHEDEHEFELSAAFDGMCFAFPTPFRRGDILVHHAVNKTDRAKPFVLSYISTWDSREMLGRGFHEHECPYWKGWEYCERFVGKLLRSGDASDMYAFGFTLMDDGTFFTDTILVIPIDLEYYRESLKGMERQLQVVSLYEKDEDEMDVECMVNCCFAIRIEEYSKKVNQQCKIYSKEILEQIGMLSAE